MQTNREIANRDFQIDLTPTEIAEAARKAAEMDNAADEIRVEMDSITKTYKARLKEHSAQIKELLQSVRTGKRRCSGECFVLYDHDRGVVDYESVEYGIVVDSRKMTKDEMQLPLFGEDK